MKLFFTLYLITYSFGVFSDSIFLDVNPKYQIKLDQDIKSLNGRTFRYDDELSNYRGIFRAPGLTSKAKIRIHGDLNSHWRSKRKSYDVKLTGENSYRGMHNFSLIRAEDKYEQMEVWGQKLAEILELPYRRIFLKELVLNQKNNGKYLVYEKLVPDMLEHLGLSGAFILSQNNAWKTSVHQKNSLIPNAFMNKELKDLKISISSTLYKIRPKQQSSQIIKNVEQFLQNSESLENLDINGLSSFLSIVAIFGSYHSVLNDNLRWLYRPWTGKFTPIYYDTIPRKIKLNFPDFLKEISRLSFLLKEKIEMIDKKKLIIQIKNKVRVTNKRLPQIKSDPIVAHNIAHVLNWEFSTN
ncbi:MAG: hypothetical protein VYA54_01580 [Bdellovibrionota bacterium]|nr:hypothetical protein [Bdellovibrionota bacterium]